MYLALEVHEELQWLFENLDLAPVADILVFNEVAEEPIDPVGT